jgi:hypothetical protein
MRLQNLSGQYQVYGLLGVTPCSVADRFQRFEGTCCLHCQRLRKNENGRSRFLRNVGIYMRKYTSL